MQPLSVCNSIWSDVRLVTLGCYFSTKNPCSLSQQGNIINAEGAFLIISDLHLGIESHFEKIGLNAFVKNSMELCEFIVKEVKGIKKKTDLDYVVFNGDLLDEFSVSKNNRIYSEKLIGELTKFTKVIILRGNHDVMINTFNFNDNTHVADFLIVGTTLVFHGDKDLSSEKGKLSTPLEKHSFERVILGHEHPSIVLSDGIRSEKAKAFVVSCKLLLNSRKVSILLLPSANPDIDGSDISSGFMSPSLKTLRAQDSHIFILEKDKLLYFGTMKDYLLSKH